jgi:hypothetical protein
MSTTAGRSPLPSRHAVRSLLEGLVGRAVDLGDAEPIPARPSNLIATYVDDRLALSAVAVVDLPGAARLGGALGLLPRNGVDAAGTDEELTDTLRDNAYEVLNVLSAVFNVDRAPHVRLYELHGPNASVPPDVVALSRRAGSRMDLRLSVAGYGDGRLSIVTDA